VSIAVFNTHASVKRLTVVGMPEARAEALADELTPLIEDRLFGTIGFQTIIVLGAMIALARVVH
jgi:hypothetical protein